MQVLVVFFFTTALVSSVLGVNFDKSFWGNPYRTDGILALSWLVGIALATGLIYKDGYKAPLVRTIFVLSILMSVLSITKLSLAGGLGNPNFLAGFLLVTFPFSHFAAKKFGGYYFAGFIIQALAILGTGARAGIVGLTFYFLIYLVGKRQYSVKALAVAALVFLISVAAVAQSELRVKKESEFVIAESRERIVTKGILAFTKRPVLGWGWANFDFAFDAIDWPLKFNDDAYVDKAHSNLLEVLVTTGAAGFVIYISIIAAAFVKLKKGFVPYFLSFVMFIFHSQTNVTHFAEEAVFWFLIGVAGRKT